MCICFGVQPCGGSRIETFSLAWHLEFFCIGQTKRMSARQPLYLSLDIWPSTVQQSIVYGTARSCGCANASDQLLLLFFAKASRTVLKEAD